jgi:4-diphosphocytidyl-2-C-methyl-D-erythritol kinase
MSSHKFTNFLSPAKLNLGLKIVGKRHDGYHLLKSVFCLIDLYDRIEIQLTDNGKISLIEHNQAWFYQKDLAYRAAVLLQEHTGKITEGANIRIKKIIPSSAGLGGGSSNAAAVLIILNQLWDTGLTTEELCQLGVKLGADVPFFITGKSALVSGIGEIIEPIELPELHFVIIKPEFHASTKQIFESLCLDMNQINATQYSVDYLINSRENDLEKVIKKLFPESNLIFSELQQYGTPALTGSGSCIYLTYTDKNSAKKVANILSPRYNTYLAASIPESPVVCN